MPTTNGNRKILDAKRQEFMTPCPSSSAAATQIISSRHFRQQQLAMFSTTSAFIYNPNEDGWVTLPSPAMATWAAGCCGTAAGFSTGSTAGAASLTATAGTVQSITTNQTLARDLRGYSVQILAGPNAGETKVIASNGIGANAVINFTTASASPFSASTVYRLMTPTWFVFGGGTLAAGSFKRYDFATNSWVTLANTGLPATFGTDGRLCASPSWIDSGVVAFATGTATAGGASTLTNSGKNWTVNQWSNSQIRLTGGTGAGQIRTIASNTATVITTSTAWTTQPDATTTYSIEGNDDFLYLLGNNAVAMYRYSISGNTWTTLAPTAARAAAPGTGASGHWVWGATASDWTNENAIQNGRFIYSFRAGAGAVLDRYDVALNTWESGLAYAPGVETFTSGSAWAYNGNFIYGTKEATGRWFAFDVTTREQVPWGTWVYPQGAAVLGDKAFDVTYIDGTTQIVYIYLLLNTSTVLLRQMVV